MFLTLIKFMNFSSYLHTIDMRSSQMGSVPDSSLRDWVWVIALCPWPRSFPLAVSVRTGKSNTWGDSEID